MKEFGLPGGVPGAPFRSATERRIPNLEAFTMKFLKFKTITILTVV